MEGIEDNNENDSNTVKKFLLEISGRFKVNSTVEFSNYQEALESFNQHSKSGKNLILYEVRKSTLDGTVVKKVPVLNTSKHAERLRMLEEEKAREKALSQKGTGTPASSADYPSSPSSSSGSSSPSSFSPGISDGPAKKNKVTLASMKYKIIILASVVAGLIITLLVLNIIADINSGGSGGGHHVILYETQHIHFQLSLGEFDKGDHTIISSHFLQ